MYLFSSLKKGMCKLNEKSTGSVLLFCILGQWFRPHFRPDCLYESRDSWQYKFSSVIAILRGKRPCFRLACVTQPRCCLSFLMMACAMSLYLSHWHQGLFVGCWGSGWTPGTSRTQRTKGKLRVDIVFWILVRFLKGRLALIQDKKFFPSFCIYLSMHCLE